MWGYELGRTARDLGVAVLIGAVGFVIGDRGHRRERGLGREVIRLPAKELLERAHESTSNLGELGRNPAGADKLNGEYSNARDVATPR